MNPSELKAFIRQVSKEKELDVAIVTEAIEQAIVSASKKNLSMFNDARAELDPETGVLRLFVKKTVANIVANPRTQVSVREARKGDSKAQVGDVVEAEIDPAAFGRIAAQSARQTVMQKLKDAERLKTMSEFETKMGEVVSGIVQRFEKRDLILSVGKSEALLPRNETPATSHYRVGDRMKVYVLEIDLNARGPIVKVSRTHPQIVAKLFEQEVPEIADGTVKIVQVARDPGSRTKIAVESTNSDVDPVGACVGVKGSRVQMIVRELENEKIDIVPYHTNIRQFIAAALGEKQIQSVNVDEATRQAIVTVKKGFLSLAIGKKGQNARLAARLTGWKLDIHSEAEEQQLAGVNPEEIQRKYLEDFLSQMEGTDESLKERVLASAYNTVQAIAAADLAELTELVDGKRALAKTMIEDAKEYEAALSEMKQSQYGDEGGDDSEGEVEAEVEGEPEEAAGEPDESGADGGPVRETAEGQTDEAHAAAENTEQH